MKSYSQTDTGKTRLVNQDYIYASTEPMGPLSGFYAVADGMGGHNAGDYASSYAIHRIVGLVRNASQDENPQDILARAVKITNEELLERSRTEEDKSGMGTTFVAAAIKDNILLAVNVGDSRLYLLHKGDLQQITEDHSYVQSLVHRGEINKEEARNHPQKNIITRAVGVMEKVEPDFFKVELTQGDKILLCSDGLSNMIDDGNIEHILNSAADENDKVIELVDTANQNGGTDNISVILVDPFAA
jgi:PPM family protein phosphatase